MSLFSRLVQTVQTWRRRKGAKATPRATVRLEQLDHRQLLSVNFTGNVPIDFPATQSPGVRVIQNTNPPPIIAPPLQPLVYNSGFSISDIAVSYTQSDDTLSVGINGLPAGPGSSQAVIGGDADDNGNSGTVNPSVTAIFPSFQDFPDFGGSEYQGINLDFNSAATPQIVAGFASNDTRSPKEYQVAQAIGPGTTGMFGTELPQFEGNVYTVNSPQHPSLEFSITHFSQLYQQVTGQALTPSTSITIGGFGGSANDTGIGETVASPGAFTLAEVTLPPLNPPPSPPILINPHEHRIIDTKHRDLVRVYIFGTSGFPVSQINPATVELDGVHAVAHITRKVKRDEFPFATYVFVADQLNLPPGLSTATLTGQTLSGVSFSSQKEVLNIPDSAKAFGILKKKMGNLSFYKTLSKIEAKNPSAVISVSNNPVTLASKNPDARGVAKVKVNYTPTLSAVGHPADVKVHQAKVRPKIAIDRSEPKGDHPKISTKLKYSMHDFLSE